LTGITVIGLGPGDAGLLTRSAWEVLETAGEAYLRTIRHPTVAALPPTLTIHSFDAIYESTEDFSEVYAQIAARIVALGGRPQGVIYAVPGDPTVGEATTWLIRRQAAEAGLSVRVIPGVSFVEPTCWALGVDLLERDGLQVLDAMIVAASHAPPFDPSRPALVAQCYSRAVASDVKLTLLHSFPPDHSVAVVRAAGTPEEQVRRVALYALDRSQDFDHLTSLYLPPIGPHGSFNRLQEIVARLRAPDGCPWDREQTLQTLRKDLLEESYELLEALDEDDDGKTAEELGDLALVVAMLAQIAAEEERFQWPAVMEHVCDKLIRRHPHVFGDVEVRGVEDVLENWAAIKRQEAGRKSQLEGGREESILASVPRALPALMLASKYQSRLARAEIRLDLAEGDPIGLALWDLVAKARDAGVDAETALREICRRAAEQVR
jgi:tetrapyrrole methylase family protein/MazG family protein